MKKLLLAAAATLLVSAAAASAQETTIRVQPALVQPAGVAAGQPYGGRLAHLRSEHAFGLYTTSAFSRNVGPGSTAGAFASSPYVNPNAGMSVDALAPSAGPVTGGGN